MNIRRLAVGAGLGFAFTVGALAMSSAAHADTKPGIVADLPGGAAGTTVRLPEKAAPRAKATVDQVVPDRPEQDAPDDDDPEPATDPRTTEPTPAPTTEPTTEPVVEVPPVVVDTPPVVVETPPVAVDPTPTTEPTPAPEPVVIVLPADDPAPLPDAGEPVTQPWPVAVPVPTLPALPVQLPVLIGPQVAEAAEPDATVGEIPAAAVEMHAEPECADTRRVIKLDRDLIQQLIDSLTAPDTSSETAKVKPGCPGKPAPMPDQPACTSTTTTNAAGNSNTHMYADTTGAFTMPALDRLEHVRARSTIPTGQHISVEPGPA